MSYQIVKSVKKAIAILEALTSRTIDEKPLTLAEISKSVGILPVTARNLLRTLEECGYVYRTAHGKYREGGQCARLFRIEGSLGKLRDVAEPILRKEVEELGESILLATLIRGKRVELLRCQAPDDIMIAPQWYANASPYQMRTTRTMLAWYSPAQLDLFIQNNGLPSPDDWPECAGARDKLQEELLRIRRAGGCMNRHNNFIAIAVPILTASGEIIATLGCYALQSRTDKPRATGIFKMLHDTTRQIQAMLV